MDWPSYTYLAGVALAALIVLVVAWRLIPRLSHPRDSRRRPTSEIILLVLVIAIGCVTIYGACLFGSKRFGYWDVGSDTLEQYVPFYENLVEGIRQGTFGAWDFGYGLGASFMAYASWANDPFNLVTVPLALALGVGQLGRILALVQVLKVFLAGFLFDHLLTFFCKAPLSRVVGGSLYAFGGWIVLWGQHYWIGAVYVMACLMALVLELLMERWSVPRFLGVMATCVLSVLMSVYSGFMVMLFATAYALLRVGANPQSGSFGRYARLFGRLVLPVVCGLLCSCVLVVPYAILILGESSRVTGAGGMSLSERFVEYLTGFVPVRWIPLILSRLLGNGLVETGGVFSQDTIPYTDAQSYLMNSYEFITVGTGGATFVLASQGIGHVLRKGSGRRKVATGIACALTVLFCINYFLPALSSAFDLKFRASFALAFPLLIAASVGWERLVSHHEVLLPELVVSSVVTLGVLAWSLLETVDGRLDCLWFIAATAVAVATLLACGRRNGTLPLVTAIACAAIVSMPVVDGFLSTNSREIAIPENFPAATTADADTTSALELIRSQNDDFYRVAKTYSDWTRLNDSLVQGFYGVSSYNSTTDSDVVEFYRQTWPDVLSAGGSKQDTAAHLDHHTLLNVLGVRYVLSKEPLDGYDWLVPVQQVGSVYVYRNDGATSLATFSSTSVAEGEVAQLAPQEHETLMAQAIITEDGVDAGGALDDGTEAQASAVGTFRTTSGQSLQGTVDVPADGTLCLAIPHTSGWTVTVDGQDTETFRANYGFIGLRLAAGEHEVVAHYRPTGLGVGVSLGIGGLALGFAGCIVGKRLSHRGKTGGTARRARHMATQ